MNIPDAHPNMVAVMRQWYGGARADCGVWYRLHATRYGARMARRYWQIKEVPNE